MSNLYDGDVVAWAYEQAALLRSGKLEQIDRFNIAEEIEDVAKSEYRELASRLAVLLSHLLKWQFQPTHRSQSWQRTIRVQRISIAKQLAKMPRLRGLFDDEDWLFDVYESAVRIASKETGLDEFPDTCPWSIPEALTPDFYPS